MDERRAKLSRDFQALSIAPTSTQMDADSFWLELNKWDDQNYLMGASIGTLSQLCVFY